MRKTLLPLLLCTASIALAQEPLERSYSIPGSLNLHGAAIDTEGHFVLANENNGDIQVTRISPTGEHEWTFKYPYFVDEGLYGNCIAAGPDGIVVVGFALGTGTISRDGIILRIDLDGTLLSSKRINAGSSNAFHTLTATSDGFIAGGRTDAGGHMYDMQLTKLNTLGEVQWSRYYGTPGWDWAYKATELHDGGFALVGYADSLGTGFSPSGYLVRTDALGNELWARSISSGNSVDEAYCVQEDSEGNLYVGGRSLGYFLGDVNAFLTKLSPTGQHLWTRVLQKGIEVVDLAPAPGGGVTWLADPQYIPQGAGDYEMLWGQFAADGTLLWSNLYGAAGSDNPLSITPMAGGGYTILGFSNSYGSNPNDWQALLLRTTAQGQADCHNISLDLQWATKTAVVTPYTSLTGSTFEAYPWPMGQEAIAVGSHDPCCAVTAGFLFTTSGDGHTFEFSDNSTNALTHSWTFGDGSTSTATSPSHTYAINGSYTVCLNVTGLCNGQTTPASSCQTISITVGINDINGQDQVPVLYPSPANEGFTVKSPRPIDLVRLTDAQGRMVDTYNAAGRLQLDIPAEHLPAGAYVAHVTDRNGNIFPLRVMVAH